MQVRLVQPLAPATGEHTRLIINTVVATCLISTLGAAQTPPMPPVSPADCLYAAQSLGQGSLEIWRWARISECGPTGASALASAIAGAHAQSDVNFLRTLLLTGNRVRDAGVSQASVALAADRSGSIAARMVGMLVAVAQRDAGTTLDMPSWTQATTVPMGDACRVTRPRDDSQWLTDLGAQAGSVETTAATLSRISVDATEPAVLRDLARCLRGLWSDVPQVIDPALITFDYVCGTKYRIENGNPHPVVLEFRLSHGPESGEITVPANGQALLNTHHDHGLEIFYGGGKVGGALNGGTPCPP